MKYYMQNQFKLSAEEISTTCRGNLFSLPTEFLLSAGAFSDHSPENFVRLVCIRVVVEGIS